jgi:4-hydroxy-tetrahydrodipicolinate synthase
MDGIVALKECERDMAQISLKIINSQLPILSGDDDLGFATILAGARGAIWASPNLAPKLCVDLFDACLAGKVDEALVLHNRLVQIFSAWMLPNHPGPLKQAMAMVGRSVGGARTPLQPCTDAQATALRAALEAHGPVA